MKRILHFQLLHFPFGWITTQEGIRHNHAQSSFLNISLHDLGNIAPTSLSAIMGHIDNQWIVRLPGDIAPLLVLLFCFTVLHNLNSSIAKDSTDTRDKGVPRWR